MQNKFKSPRKFYVLKFLSTRKNSKQTYKNKWHMFTVYNNNIYNRNTIQLQFVKQNDFCKTITEKLIFNPY